MIGSTTSSRPRPMASPAPHRRPGRHGAGAWAVTILGVVLILLGITLAAGGVWLITLDGSWYYALAGLGLVVSGWLLLQLSMAGVWLYLLTYALTLLWAVWEVGWAPWPLVPRVVAPTILLILVLLAIPVLSHRRRRVFRRPGAVPTALAGLVLGLGGAGLLLPGTLGIAQVEPPPEAASGTEPAPAEAGTDAPSSGEASAIEETAAEDTAAQDTSAAEVQVPEAPGWMPAGETGSDWPAYGGTIHATRFSPLDQITPDNVASLERVWEIRTGDMPSDAADGKYSPENTPLKVGDSLYICTAKNILIALEPETGRERWRYDPGVSDDAIPYGATCRGVAYYAIPGMDETELCATRVIEGTLDARLIAVDAQTGQPCAAFGTQGAVNLLEGIGDSVPGFFSVTSPPTIVRGVVVIGQQVLDGQRRDAPSGVVRGYDAVTGALLWAWDMLQPELDGLPPDGETYSRGTPNMWTIASGDDELGLVYLPMGNSAVDYYGADRSAVENAYATSLVAIDVTTGEVAWHFQTVYYDVWDYDLGSQGTLVDFPTADGPVPAVILPSKQGDIYVLDRRTGEPLVPFEERPVPQGGVEPENLSPTQPFSLYHTVRQPDLEERDMWGMSPLDQLWCRIQFRRAAYDGIYQPPTADRHWIQYPGYNGGSDWGGIAIDAERGIIVVNYNDMPNFNRLIPREEADARGWIPVDEPGGPVGDPQAGAPYAIEVNAGWRLFTGLLCKEPPYGGIRAVDLATGETLWDQPLGTARKNGPFGIPSMMPFPIGTPNNGGAVITASGLIFIAATTDDLIRAIDIETGEVLWEDTLPAGGQATPMTYEHNGRQYIAFMAGGHHFMETPIGDYVLAWALPAE